MTATKTENLLSAIVGFDAPKKPNSSAITVDPNNASYILRNAPYPKEYGDDPAKLDDEARYNVGVYETYAKVAIYLRRNGVDWSMPENWDYSDVAEMEEAIEGFSMPPQWSQIAENLVPSSDTFALGVRDALASILLSASGGEPRTPRDPATKQSAPAAAAEPTAAETTTVVDYDDNSVPALIGRLGGDPGFEMKGGKPPEEALATISLSLPPSVLDALALVKAMYVGTEPKTKIDLENNKLEIQAWLPTSP